MSAEGQFHSLSAHSLVGTRIPAHTCTHPHIMGDMCVYAMQAHTPHVGRHTYVHTYRVAFPVGLRLQLLD